MWVSRVLFCFYMVYDRLYAFLCLISEHLSFFRSLFECFLEQLARFSLFQGERLDIFSRTFSPLSVFRVWGSPGPKAGPKWRQRPPLERCWSSLGGALGASWSRRGGRNTHPGGGDTELLEGSCLGVEGARGSPTNFLSKLSPSKHFLSKLSPSIHFLSKHSPRNIS